MKAREYNSPLIKELLDETTPEEMEQISKQMESIKDLQWFKDRIGKRVYRKNNVCKCPICLDAFENGLIIKDEDHAYYLRDIQNELGLTYQDTK